MKKAIVVLNASRAKHELKDICKTCDISYRYCYSLLDGEKNPTWNVMNKFKSMIPIDFWFDEADNEFIKTIRERLIKVTDKTLDS